MKYSAYLTTRNCVGMNYPFKESIKSTFQFADEIVICDSSDGSDGTKDILQDLSKEFGSNFKIIHPDFVDWEAPNSGIYDGQTKAFARANCTGDYLWQMDVDEILENDCKSKIDDLASKLDKENPLISTLVVEYWGAEKVRIDINAWKERLSLNDPNITHGIPKPLITHVDGLMYSKPGSDGCNVLWKSTLMPVSCLNFITPKSEQVRQLAVKDLAYVPVYENWLNKIGDRLPVIHHLSWYSVYEKMVKYKLFWNNSWQRLYNEQRPAGYNPFFNKPFEEVTDEEMLNTARTIEQETAGHIFHQPYISGVSPKTNGVKFNKPIPVIVQDWCDNNKTK